MYIAQQLSEHTVSSKKATTSKLFPFTLVRLHLFPLHVCNNSCRMSISRIRRRHINVALVLLIMIIHTWSVRHTLNWIDTQLSVCNKICSYVCVLVFPLHFHHHSNTTTGGVLEHSFQHDFTTNIHQYCHVWIDIFAAPHGHNCERLPQDVAIKAIISEIGRASCRERV